MAHLLHKFYILVSLSVWMVAPFFCLTLCLFFILEVLRVSTSCLLVLFYIYIYMYVCMHFLCRWIVQPLVLSNNRTNHLRRRGDQGDLFMYE